LYLLGILFPKKKSLFNIVLSLFVFLIGVFLSFRIFQPYAFDSFLHLSNNFVKNINTARQMITGDFDYPPNIQWAYTIPLYHPLKNILLWGLGLPLSIITFLGVVFLIKTSKKRELLYQLLFITFFVIIIFLYQGIQLAKYMRYFYPIYPLLAIFSGYFISIVNKQKSFLLKILVAVLVASWPLCFIKIYSQPHTRYTASNWIYHHLPIGSKIIAEEWDDSLPISLNQDFYSELYSIKPLNFYEPETTKKWEKITQTINEADYIILSSNRQYGSIPKFPTRYLVASLYYSLLFREKLGFKKIAEFTSYPVFNDDQAEESFTVYDHPKVIVFAKNHFNPELLRRLTNQKLINKAIYLNPKSTM